MDGSNVNWKLFKNLSNDIEEETKTQLLLYWKLEEYWKLYSSHFTQCLQEWNQFVHLGCREHFVFSKSLISGFKARRVLPKLLVPLTFP